MKNFKNQQDKKKKGWFKRWLGRKKYIKILNDRFDGGSINNEGDENNSSQDSQDNLFETFKIDKDEFDQTNLLENNIKNILYKINNEEEINKNEKNIIEIYKTLLKITEDKRNKKFSKYFQIDEDEVFLIEEDLGRHLFTCKAEFIFLIQKLIDNLDESDQYIECNEFFMNNYGRKAINKYSKDFDDSNIVNLFDLVDISPIEFQKLYEDQLKKIEGGGGESERSFNEILSENTNKERNKYKKNEKSVGGDLFTELNNFLNDLNYNELNVIKNFTIDSINNTHRSNLVYNLKNLSREIKYIKENGFFIPGFEFMMIKEIKLSDENNEHFVKNIDCILFIANKNEYTTNLNNEYENNSIRFMYILNYIISQCKKLLWKSHNLDRQYASNLPITTENFSNFTKYVSQNLDSIITYFENNSKEYYDDLKKDRDRYLEVQEDLILLKLYEERKFYKQAVSTIKVAGGLTAGFLGYAPGFAMAASGVGDLVSMNTSQHVQNIINDNKQDVVEILGVASKTKKAMKENRNAKIREMLYINDMDWSSLGVNDTDLGALKTLKDKGNQERFNEYVGNLELDNEIKNALKNNYESFSYNGGSLGNSNNTTSDSNNSNLLNRLKITSNIRNEPGSTTNITNEPGSTTNISYGTHRQKEMTEEYKGSSPSNIDDVGSSTSANNRINNFSNLDNSNIIYNDEIPFGINFKLPIPVGTHEQEKKQIEKQIDSNPED